jgi:hypothetical protein
MLENTKVAIKNGQSRETGNIDEETHNTTQHNTTMRKQTQIRHDMFYKQLEVKTNRTSFLCGNRNGHHNTKLRM